MVSQNKMVFSKIYDFSLKLTSVSVDDGGAPPAGWRRLEVRIELGATPERQAW